MVCNITRVLSKYKIQDMLKRIICAPKMAPRRYFDRYMADDGLRLIYQLLKVRGPFIENIYSFKL